MSGSFGLRELVIVCLVLSSLVGYSEQAKSFEVRTLLRVRELLNSPASLRSWNNETDFCNAETSSSVTVVCYEGSITQLHIISEKGTPQLPENFSIDAFVSSLVKLPSLKVLKLVSLGLWGPLPGKISRLSGLEILDLSSNFFHNAIPREISSLINLQTLILDGNKFTGRLPDGLGLLSDLAVLSVKNNSFRGPLPDTLGDLQNLRILALSRNNFTGNVPDLSNLENLQVLDLEDNSFGPKFPLVGSKIVSLVLRRNRFTSSIPENVQSCHQLEHLDVSSNGLVGPFPSSLLSLPLISYLSIAENKLTGMLFENLPCNSALNFVDLSANLLTGALPSCLHSGSKTKVVLYTGNCLETGDKNQHPVSFCRNEALAVGIIPRHHRKKIGSKAILALSICGSVIGGAILLAVAFLVVRSFGAKKTVRKTPTRLIMESASTAYTSKLFSDARYITQAMKLGSLSVPSYRTFSLEELEEATNNFDTSTFVGEGSTGQIYRGRLRDGSFVAIRCLKLKRSNSIQNFMHQIEFISKLRHQHLVSALGHCFECYLDDSSVSRIFLVFEYVPNGTLRSWISDKHSRRRLNWAQRVSAAIGIAKGIQFLHTGIVPGVFSNDLKITDILLDQNLVAKISSFNLPILDESTGKASLQDFPSGSKELNGARERYNEKLDVYDFGVILLEIITGRRINTKKDMKILKEQLQASLTGDDAWRRSVVDPRVKNSSSDESVKTMVEICYRCLLEDPADRPSVEDVLWNLQFAAQVQDACRGDSQSSDSSPISPFQPSRQIAIR
nr:probable inactive leucine-rich repeat receptor-like protein kinase At3g03770 [Ipomoea trifida]